MNSQKTKILLSCVLLFLCSCSHVQRAYMAVLGNPYEDDSQYAQTGERVYEMHCLRCHGKAGKGDGPEFTEKMANIPNFNDGTYEKSLGLTAANIYYGKREMPAFGETLSEREVWAVARYLRTLDE